MKNLSPSFRLAAAARGLGDLRGDDHEGGAHDIRHVAVHPRRPAQGTHARDDVARKDRLPAPLRWNCLGGPREDVFHAKVRIARCCCCAGGKEGGVCVAYTGRVTATWMSPRCGSRAAAAAREEGRAVCACVSHQEMADRGAVTWTSSTPPRCSSAARDAGRCACRIRKRIAVARASSTPTTPRRARRLPSSQSVLLCGGCGVLGVRRRSVREAARQWNVRHGARSP